MGLRYIGSKARVADEIIATAGSPARGSRFVDAFCGTGAVAVAAAAAGYDVHVNDALLSSVIMTTARLVSSVQVPFAALGGYERAVALLNNAEGPVGFLTREYSPMSLDAVGHERRYFTVENAVKLDAVRKQIEVWRLDHSIAALEAQLLIADLMVAANEVANIAGTYGCYLSEWSSQARRPLVLRPRRLASRPARLTTSVGDVHFVTYESADLAYFDPPYTKRQYAAYYHVLETIAAGDAPAVAGVTGLRPWRHLSSEFCYRKKALIALDRLLRECAAHRILLSYSSQGHVARGELEAVLSRHGDLVVHELGAVGRYRPNRVAAAASAEVDEYLFEVFKLASKREPSDGRGKRELAEAAA